MNKREKFLKEIAEVINRNWMEAYFNDTPDYILAKVAVVAMENFAEASARRELARVQEADKPGEVVRNEDCGNCANFTNEDVNGNGYCEAFKCEQSCGVMPCQEYKPKNQ